VVALHYGDGSGQYVMPLHLPAQASTTIDIGMLIAMGQPDANGNLIPSYIQEGSAVVSNPKGLAQWMTVAVCAAFYNPRKATCGGPYCIDCYGFDDEVVLLDPVAVAVTGTVQLQAQATYSNGTVVSFTTSSTWSSSNTAVATVGASTGLVSGVSPGSALMSAQFPDLVDTTEDLCSTTGGLACPTDEPSEGSGGGVLTVTQSPSSFNMSTGDTVTITVNVSGAQGSVTISFTGTSSPTSNPNSSCAVSLTIPSVSGTGALSTKATASPAGCSGVFSVTGSVSGVQSNSITVNVPPQVLIQMMQEEAGGQNDSCQESLGLVARNRIGNATYFAYATNWQNVFSQQFSLSSVTTGVQDELNNAVSVFTGAADFTGGSGCFWSPTYAQWQNIQAALNSGTTTFPYGNGDPGCYGRAPNGPQAVYLSSVGTSNRGGQWAGAPAFLFERPSPSPTAAAVVQLN
jgi:hypothetical protein